MESMLSKKVRSRPRAGGHQRASESDKSKVARVREWFETHRGVPATTDAIVEAVNADGDSQINAQFVHQTVGTIKGVIRNLVKINGQSRTTYCLPESK